ncbi:hypothetical protein Lal_00041651 [Lupinus albus]|nr:hypothetical protein Lal_00041651 [Lupinus albus]
MSFRLQTRKNEAQTLLSSRRLFHQFLVDAYTMVVFYQEKQKKTKVIRVKDLIEEKESYYLQLLLVAVDTWINYILMG